MSNDNRQQDGTNLAPLEAKLVLDGIEDIEILKAKAQEERDARVQEAEARRQLTARAKAAEDKLKETPIKTQDNTKPYSILDDEAASMILDGYKPDEVRFIMQNGGMSVLKDKESFVTIAVEAKREQRKAADAAAQAEGSGKSDILKQYTAEQLKAMKSKDLEKLLPKTY
jgi:hypothetical protein